MPEPDFPPHERSPDEAAIPDHGAFANTSEVEDLRREVGYLFDLVEQTASRMLAVDAQTVAVRHELEQKRRGFRLMAELAVAIGQDADFERLFISVSRRINATLNMQRTVILFPDDDGRFKPTVLQGYSIEERRRMGERSLAVPEEMLNPFNPVVVTGADAPERFQTLRAELGLPHFIAVPVMIHNRVAALLLTGRMLEQKPYFPRLDAGDVETVQTVGAYLAAMLAGHGLRREANRKTVDPVTGLLTMGDASGYLRRLLALARKSGFRCAVLCLNLDGFKEINVVQGHAAGDVVLRTVAERLASLAGEADFAARVTGDEYMLVLAHIDGPDDAAAVAGQILKKLDAPINIGDAFCKVGASIGIAVHPEHGDDAQTLVRAAEDAVEKVKASGRNNFSFSG